MRLRASKSSIEPGEKNSSAYANNYYGKFINMVLRDKHAPRLHFQIPIWRLRQWHPPLVPR
jgi:hypothetical protein